MKLALGTVQFGINYGVANSQGQVSKQGVMDILRLAESAGLNVLDTAVAYGSAEKTLGDIGISGWSCITKLPPMPYDELQPKKWVETQIKGSLKRLNLTNLSAVLLHQPGDILGPNSQEYLYGLQEMRNQGYVNEIGYSIYSPEVLEEITEVFWPNIIQTPYNVFDQRIKTSGWLDKLAARGTKIHARSVFLQGLLLMSRYSRPSYFEKWGKQLKNWDELVASQELTAMECALNFVAGDSRFDSVIVGVDSANQLKELISAYGKQCELPLERLEVADPDLIEPFRWLVA